MAAFLKRRKQLVEAPTTCTVNISSRRRAPSDQNTKFDKPAGVPIIAPLDTVEQVLSWQPGRDELCVASVPLPPGKSGGLMGDPSAQKMIVCHDMMGGYVKDKFTQGIRDLEDYYFYHWQHIGAFIYFSHHSITIPPPCWTNAAHRHGVLSMGTLITEWEDGAKMCFSFLQNESKVSQFAEQLVALAQYYGFDGWLVNIENPIHPMLLDQLYMFMSLLTTGMHGSCPGSKVIWYDSITTAGALQWQNQLNHLNQPYFDLCDGIFLNYNWTEVGLAASASLAKERKGEVYVGIDVFGRGCPGGGGYNSSAALKRIHRHGLSSALFAPGWVFETMDKRCFFANQNRFWSLLQPWLPVVPVTSLPLVSSFGRGCGTLVAIDGEVVYAGEWTNHSAQDLQPSYVTESSLQNDTESAIELKSAELDLTTAFNNGASLLVQGRVRGGQQGTMTKPAILRLFKTKLSLSKPLVVAYTCKVGGADPITQGYRYFLQLHTTGSPTRVFLDPLSSPSVAVPTGEDTLLVECGLPRSRHVPALPGCVLAPLGRRHSTVLHQINTGSAKQGDSWRTSYFVVDRAELQGKHIKEISMGFYAAGTSQTQKKHFSLNIGQIKVMDSHCFSPKPEPSFLSNVWCRDYHFSADGQTVSFTVSWQSMSNTVDRIDHCNIYLSTVITDTGQDTDPSTLVVTTPWKSDHVFLGRSYAKSCYRVTNLYLLSAPSEGQGQEEKGGCQVLFELRVQPVTVSQCKPQVADCPSILLDFKTIGQV